MTSLNQSQKTESRIKDGSWLQVTSATLSIGCSFRRVSLAISHIPLSMQERRDLLVVVSKDARALLLTRCHSFPRRCPRVSVGACTLARRQRFALLQSQAFRSASVLFQIGVCLSCCPLIKCARTLRSQERPPRDFQR